MAEFGHDHFDPSSNEMELSMFNGNFRHPLDNLIRDDRLFIMEAIIPFVDDNMKAPLAMYIKFMELKAILEALRDPGYVNSCGLHKDINNQDDILSSLAGCGFPDIRDQFASMKKAIDMMKTMEAMNTQQSTDSLYRHYQSRTASETEGEENYDNTESQSSQDIYSSVKDLFEKYDMEGY